MKIGTKVIISVYDPKDPYFRHNGKEAIVTKLRNFGCIQVKIDESNWWLPQSFLKISEPTMNLAELSTDLFGKLKEKFPAGTKVIVNITADKTEFFHLNHYNGKEATVTGTCDYNFTDNKVILHVRIKMPYGVISLWVYPEWLTLGVNTTERVAKPNLFKQLLKLLWGSQ